MSRYGRARCSVDLGQVLELRREVQPRAVKCNRAPSAGRAASHSARFIMLVGLVAPDVVKVRLVMTDGMPDVRQYEPTRWADEQSRRDEQTR